LALLGSAGCGADFDSPDKVSTLRVFAVQKDPPYAPPTTDLANPSLVNLTMLWYDGGRAYSDEIQPRPIQRIWFSGCDDLPGDQYFTCLAYMHFMWKLYYHADAKRALPADGTNWSPVDDADALPDYVKLVHEWIPQLDPMLAPFFLSNIHIGTGSTFQYKVPPYIVEGRPRSTDPTIPPYGIGFVFFTACAGHIVPAPAWEEVVSVTQLSDATRGFPFTCNDENEVEVGPNDFVAGYTQEFVYGDGSTNNNPVIGPDDNTTVKTAMVFDGKEVKPDAYCIDGDCVPPSIPNPTVCTGEKDASASVQTYPHVKKCSGKCPEYDFRPTLDPDKNNDDTRFGPPNQPGEPKPEQMWINYYADKGTLKHTVRLLRDADNGWAPNPYNSTWTPPIYSGPVNLWTVVHDVRGGASWIRLLVCVDD